MNPIISMTASALATATKDARAVAVVKSVTDGKWQQPVEHIRAELLTKGKDGVSELKKRLPGVLPSGKFDRRSNSGLVAYSGLLCADLDDLGDRLPDLRWKLINDPHVWALFLSPTGTGLKVWFRVDNDATKHAASFAVVQRRCRELYGVEIDPACKDVARLCFVSYDPAAFLNQDAAELPVLAEPVAPMVPCCAPTPAKNSYDMPPSAQRLFESGAPAGERNRRSFDLACQFRDMGMTEAEAQSRIIEFAARCNPPMGNNEALATVRSAYAAPRREPARSMEPVRLKIPAATGATISPDQETFLRLALLPPADYDRQREAEAEKLGIRCSTLDEEVAKWRAPENDSASVQGGAVDFPRVEPWPQPVQGTEILDAVAATFNRYIVLPLHAAVVLALWTAAAHIFDAFLHSPRLNLRSPEKGCGKTTLLDVLAALLPCPLRTESITPAVLFRIVDAHKPALLLDEIDTYLNENDELRGLLNAGHKRGAKAYRCESDRHEVRGFNAFAPAVLAGIGTLPGTLHDRAIVICLLRAKRGEITARFDSRRTVAEAEQCRKLARWAADNRTQLESFDPAMPEGVFNRLADNWRPLFAVAQIAGGDWPARAAAAFTAMTATDEMDSHGIGASLLADIRTIFTDAGTDRLASARIAEVLGTMDGKPWPEFKNGKPITPNQVARLLRRFDIHSRTIRLDDHSTAKGYPLSDFDDAFARFLPAPPPNAARNSVTTIENTGDSPSLETSQPDGLLPFETTVSGNVGAGCDGVTVQNEETQDAEVRV